MERVVRLHRLGPRGAERPCVFDSAGRSVDLSAEIGDFGHEFFAAHGMARLATLAADDFDGLPRLAHGRLGPPISRPGKVVCIGLNYADHARESGQAIPAEPIVFFKDPWTVVGPNDDVLIPRGSTKTDWEVELGVVIGRRCRYLQSENEARGAIVGYAVSHDVSEREFQLERGGQWVKGKSCETFNPLGPWLVSADEVATPGDLRLWLDVNGRRKQDGSTSSMIFAVPYLIWYLSQFMVLEPGDLINTGTPAGVALGATPSAYLTDGDVVELGVDLLGTQRQTFRNAD